VQKPIPFPIGGLSDDGPFSEQPPNTTPDAQNVRAIDSPTGRTRGSVRSGITEVSSTPVNGNNVGPKRMVQVTFDSRKSEYTGIGPTSANETSPARQPASPVYNLAVDKQGNRYTIDGKANLIKYTSSNEAVWSFAVPVLDTAHLCRAIAVDDNGLIFVGVSANGRVEDARIFALQQLPDESVEVLWTQDAGGFVETLSVYRSRLIALVNNTTTWESWVVAYDGAQTVEPSEAWRSVAAYPSNGMWVDPKRGRIAVCANGNATRGYLPEMATTSHSKVTTDWTPRDVANYERRIWAWYRAEDLADALEDGAEVTVWPDRSGNGRHLYLPASVTAPTFVRRSMGRKAAVRFASGQYLKSAMNGALTRGFATEQSTVVPAYKHESGTTGYTGNTQFAMFVLGRTDPSAVDPSAGTLKGMCFFRQKGDNAATAAASYSHHLILNLNTAALTLNACAYSANQLRYAYTVDATTNHPVLVNASGTTVGTVLQGSWSSGLATTNAFLSTLVVNFGQTQAAGDHPSVLRVNGTEIDTFSMGTAAPLNFLSGSTGASEVGSVPITSTTVDPFRGTISEIIVFGPDPTNTVGNFRPLSYPWTAGYAGGIPDATGDSDLERVEGYLVHDHGCSEILPAGHAFSLSKGPPNKLGITSHSLPWLLNSAGQSLARWSPAGELEWVLTSYDAYRAFAEQSVGGLGFGVSGDSDGNLYTIGPIKIYAPGANNDYSAIRKIIDNGGSATFSAPTTTPLTFSATKASTTGAWNKTHSDLVENTVAPEPTMLAEYAYRKLGTDKHDVTYYPWDGTAGSQFVDVAVVAYDKTGGNGFTNSRAITGAAGLTLSGNPNCYVAIPDPNVPEYEIDKTTGNRVLTGSEQNALPRAEFLYVGVSGTTPVRKVAFVTVGQKTGSPRELQVLTVCGGAVKKGTATISAPAGFGTLAQPELSSTAEWIDAAVAFARVYFTDRNTYREYDPKTDVVKEYKATKGRIPPRCSFLTFWRGRMVAARAADDGHLWHMSKQGDVYDWDTDPAVISSVQAVSGSSSGRIGACPDIINGVVSVNDDVLLILCDHSTWQLTGDPQAGGEFDLISDVVGGAFGRGQVLDPEGRVYWFGSRGGVYRKAPFGPIERISVRSIERRLQNVDLSTVTIGMEWDYEDEGLRIFQFRYSPNGAVQTHWFWDAKNGGWWEDKYGLTNYRIQPTATLVSDGDGTSDRVLLYGCEDGFIRKVDRTSKKDGTTASFQSPVSQPVPIAAHVVIGPLWAAEEGQEGRITSVTAEMSSTQGEAIIELFTSDVSDNRGSAKAEFTAGPGRSPKAMIRARGAYAWLKLRSADHLNRWALEHLELEVYPAGRKRVSP